MKQNLLLIIAVSLCINWVMELQAQTNMALIPPGPFQMGDSFAEGSANELPVHAVYVSAFLIEKLEVTKEIWSDVFDWAINHGYSFQGARDGGGGDGVRHPAHPIWYDAIKWCNARSEKEGLTPVYYTTSAQTVVYRSGQVDVVEAAVKWAENGYRLPTEAEWEKAARGGLNGKRYPWGDTINGDDANYFGSGDPFEGMFTASTPVGYYNGGQSPSGGDRANGYGLYDMAGNALEFCWDWLGDTYYGSVSALDNPRGPNSSPINYRVLRGGGWRDNPGDLRCAVRRGTTPGNGDHLFGFRCVRNPVVPLIVVQTNRTPTQNEITLPLPAIPTPSQLMSFHSGIFTTNLNSVYATNATIVFTHGWNSNPNEWASNMASRVRASGIADVNLVAWDWTEVAKSSQFFPGIPEAQTGDQGRALGVRLFQTLGANYSQPIHFVGHSLGTLVNASAANFLQGTNRASEPVSPAPWPATNMLMTLFDEAETAREKDDLFTTINLLRQKLGNPLSAATATGNPLPKNFAWAENYISAFGLPYTRVVNVILTNGFPRDAYNPFSWKNKLTDFHSYPMTWYDETIQTVNSDMGFVWPFLWSQRDSAFESAPTNGSIFVQSFHGSEWDLSRTNWSYATDLLDKRFEIYLSGLAEAFQAHSPVQIWANGPAQGESIIGDFAWSGLLVTLHTATRVLPLQQRNVHYDVLAGGDAGADTNTPAYVWFPLLLPSNAIAMTFAYNIAGNWQNDSLAAALNGTNVFLLSGSQIETNVTFSSGPIDISAFAGQTNEFFVGIVGGTSTNAQATVMNVQFFGVAPPTLQIKGSGENVVLSWPLAAQEFALQYTTNLYAPTTWITMTNIPAVVDLQNTLTNPISDDTRFYRLKK